MIRANVSVFVLLLGSGCAVIDALGDPDADVVAGPINDASAMVIANGRIFVASSGDGTILEVGSDGTLDTLASSETLPATYDTVGPSLVVAGDHLYWRSGTSSSELHLRRMALAGGAPEEVPGFGAADVHYGTIAAGAQALFICATELHRLTATSADVIPKGAFNCDGGMEVRGGTLVSGNSAGVHQLVIDTGEVSTLLASISTSDDCSLDTIGENELYTFANPFDGDVTVLRTQFGGSSPSLLGTVSGLDSCPTSVWRREGTLYFGQNGKVYAFDVATVDSEVVGDISGVDDDISSDTVADLTIGEDGIYALVRGDRSFVVRFEAP